MTAIWNSLTIVVINKISSTFILHSWLITGFVTRLTRWVSLAEQELVTLLEHMSSPRFWRGSCYSIFIFMIVVCPFVLFLCVVCPSWIYEFWLPLWYHQTLLTDDSWYVCSDVFYFRPFNLVYDTFRTITPSNMMKYQQQAIVPTNIMYIAMCKGWTEFQIFTLLRHTIYSQVLVHVY